MFHATTANPTPPADARRRGIVMMDVLMTITLIGVALLAIVPTMAPGEPMKAVAAATMLSADLEAAQSLTLVDPADPTILRFEADGSGYWLALASTPETPITKAYSEEPYHVVFGEGNARSLDGVVLVPVELDGDHVEFDALGRLIQADDLGVRVENNDETIGVLVRASTGSVAIVDEAHLPAPAAPGPGPAPVPGPSPAPGPEPVKVLP